MAAPKIVPAKAAPAPRGRRKPGATRERILASAGRLFAARGFSGVTMPLIAQASGITAGAIYKHFTSKAELFFEVVRRSVETAPAAADGSLLDAVASYTTRRLKRVRQMAVEVHYAAGRNPEVRRLLRRTLDRQLLVIGDGLAAGQRSGELAPGPDPELLAAAAMVFIMGLMHLETLSPRLVGDAAWQAFVKERLTALLGAC